MNAEPIPNRDWNAEPIPNRDWNAEPIPNRDWNAEPIPNRDWNAEPIPGGDRNSLWFKKKDSERRKSILFKTKGRYNRIGKHPIPYRTRIVKRFYALCTDFYLSGDEVPLCFEECSTHMFSTKIRFGLLAE